jgi:hypothetical protein
MRILALVLVALFATTGAALAACGGGDGDRTIDTGDGEVNLSDDLPDDFPDDFPIYDGADFQGSVESNFSGASGELASAWRTGDDIDDVKAWYEQELEDGPWTATSSTDVGGTVAWEVNKGERSARVGLLAADGTTILVWFPETEDAPPDDGASGDDGDSEDEPTQPADGGEGEPTRPADGSEGDGTGSADLPAEVDLPDNFPTDISLPDDVRVTNATTFTNDAQATIFVELYSQESMDDLAEFFQTELTANGWTETFTTASAEEVFASYSKTGANGSAESATITINPSGVEGYQKVGIGLNVVDTE